MEKIFITRVVSSPLGAVHHAADQLCCVRDMKAWWMSANRLCLNDEQWRREGGGAREDGRPGRHFAGGRHLRSGLECRLGVPVHCLQSNGVIIHMTSRTLHNAATS